MAHVIDGLRRQPRHIHCKYLYDKRGSELFDQICKTDDYYVTRADLALHEAHLGEISEQVGPDAHVIEFGSGSGIKTRRWLESLQSPRAYTPIEISAAALESSVSGLKRTFPDLDVRPVQADYTQQIAGELLRLDPPARRRIVYFPGSTISNFAPEEAVGFLRRMRNIAGADGAILIGVDLLKPEETLLRAYDDREGITAAFNRNLLLRLQRELGARLDIEAFDHLACFDPALGRIEMHLVANRPTRIEIGSHRFKFDAGDGIHTENSYKYTVEGFTSLARRAGLSSTHVWTDPEGLFSMHWLEAVKGER
jgi:L-histidine Nalpha-methyltransferase